MNLNPMNTVKWIQVRVRWHAVRDMTERTLCGQNIGDMPHRELVEHPGGTVCITCWRTKAKRHMADLESSCLN